MERFGLFHSAVSRAGEVFRSAQELLKDKELRSKGIQTVLTGAQTRLQGIQNGILQRAGRLQERLLENQRQLQTLMLSLEESYNAMRRASQLNARRQDKVDVQFGRQVIENAPQEIRARLWYVLLENPHLAAPLKCEYPASLQNLMTHDIGGEDSDNNNDVDDDASSLTRGSLGRNSVGAPMASVGSTGSRFGAMVAALGFNRQAAGGGGGMNVSPSAASLSSLSRRGDPSGSGGGRLVAAGPLTNPATTTTATTDMPSEVTHPYPHAGQQQQHSQPQPQPPTPGNVRAQVVGGGPAAAAAAAPSPQGGRASRAGLFGTGEVASTVVADSGGGGGYTDDGWELVMPGTTDAGGLPVSGPLVSGPSGGGQQHPEAIRIILERLDALGHLALDESGSDPVLVAQQAVLEAMLQVPWENGVGLPAEVPSDSRFAVLNEMTAGQEEVDDSILRDIHRTFPEHPYFGMEAGQRSLFRVLKAYSLHDLEAAYCQGMAFMAGVLLMYVPEETAFRLFCRLMDPEGPNLRRLYLPGLEPLKAELATFELLMTWRQPELATHLSEFGLPPVLYVSQWLMTLFATPFPPAFCARVIDVLLQDGHDRLLLRCSFAVVEALEPGLLERHDFEALITYLKMEPVSWGLDRQRVIMERALTSPLTDAEIDVARDTVANRKIVAAALAASSTSTTAAGVNAGLCVTAAGELLSSGGTAAPCMHHQRKLSLEAEVDAALTAAAVALSAAEGGGAAGGDSGCSRDGGGVDERDAGGRGGAGPVVSSFPGMKSTMMPVVRGRYGPDGVDMISFEEEGIGRSAADAGGGASAAAAGPGGGGGGNGGDGCRSGSKHPQGRGWEPDLALGLPSGSAGHSRGGVETAGESGCSSAAARQRVGGVGSSYGMSPSLLDDLDFGGGNAAAAGPKAPDLEYGEYGEMLMDAGVLLPELGACAAAGGGTAAPPMAAVVAAVAAGGCGGLFAPLGSLAAGGDAGDPLRTAIHANPQRQHVQAQPGTDLLLD